MSLSQYPPPRTCSYLTYQIAVVVRCRSNVAEVDHLTVHSSGVEALQSSAAAELRSYIAVVEVVSAGIRFRTEVVVARRTHRYTAAAEKDSDMPVAEAGTAAAVDSHLVRQATMLVNAQLTG